MVKWGPSLVPTANNPVKTHFVRAAIFLSGRKVIFIVRKTLQELWIFFFLFFFFLAEK